MRVGTIRVLIVLALVLPAGAARAMSTSERKALRAEDHDVSKERVEKRYQAPKGDSPRYHEPRAPHKPK